MKTNNEVSHKWGFTDFLKDIFLYITLVLSGLIAYFSNEEFLRSVVDKAGSAMVEMSGALFGIVLAGLAIFIVFLDRKYIRLIKQVIGISSSLIPIKTVAFLTILCLAFGLGLIILGEPSSLILRVIIGIALWIYFYLLVQMWEFVKWLIEHAKARAMQIEMNDEENQG